jgi:hypothetical protein
MNEQITKGDRVVDKSDLKNVGTVIEITINHEEICNRTMFGIVWDGGNCISQIESCNVILKNELDKYLIKETNEN